MTRRGRGRVKRGQTSLASDQFLMCSPQSGTLREVHSYIEKRRGKKDIEATRRRRGGFERKETDLARNQSPKCSPWPRTPTEIHRFR